MAPSHLGWKGHSAVPPAGSAPVLFWPAYLGLATFGFLIGLGSAYMIVQVGKQWAKSVTLAAVGTYVVVFVQTSKQLGLPDEHPTYAYFCAMVLALAAGLVSALWLAVWMGRKMQPDLTPMEVIILGAEQIERIANAKGTIAAAEKRQQELQQLEARLTRDREVADQALRKREEAAGKREEVLGEREARYRRQTEEGVHLPLPIDARAPFDTHSVAKLPQFVGQFAEFSSLLSEATDGFIHAWEGSSVEAVMEGYLYYVCKLTVTALFNVTTGVRVHFRVLRGTVYQSLVCTLGTEIYTQAMADIPAEGSLIAASAEVGRSLLKSMNPGRACKGSHDNVWQDYLTIAFPSFKDPAGRSLLSMGISVENATVHAELLQLLNHFAVEKVIDRKLKELDAVVGFSKILLQPPLAS